MPQFQEKSLFETWPALRYVIYAIIALILSVLHVVFLNLISVSSITPDLLLVLCVWISITEGQFIGIFAGFGCGLLFDVLSADVLGTNALAKTLAAFVAGYFFKAKFTDQTIGSYKFIIAVFVCSMVHNLTYFFFFFRPTEISFSGFFLKYGIASTLYTSVSAVFPMLIKAQKLTVRH